MPITARSYVTTASHSYDTGRKTGASLLDDFVGTPQLALVYLTVNHQAADFLRGLSETLGEGVDLVGCSAQGVMGRGAVHEEGFAASAMLIGGDGLQVASARASRIAQNTVEQGRLLGDQLCRELRQPPRFVVLHYDALSGADVDELLQGLASRVECPVVGGAAAGGLPFDINSSTPVYFGREATPGGAVAFAAAGDFVVETEICHGCAPVGVAMTVTRSKGSMLLELDGRSAGDVWVQTGGPAIAPGDATVAVAIGVPDADAPSEYLVRAAYSIDCESGGVGLGAHIPEGTRIMLHHRSVEDVLAGARRMADSLAQRLAGRRVRAALGFECGARTRPFLGAQRALNENLALQERIGECDAWVGMMPWGELYPVARRPAFHNYSYPLLVIAE